MIKERDENPNIYTKNQLLLDESKMRELEHDKMKRGK